MTEPQCLPECMTYESQDIPTSISGVIHARACPNRPKAEAEAQRPEMVPPWPNHCGCKNSEGNSAYAPGEHDPSCRYYAPQEPRVARKVTLAEARKTLLEQLTELDARLLAERREELDDLDPTPPTQGGGEGIDFAAALDLADFIVKFGEPYRYKPKTANLARAFIALRAALAEKDREVAESKADAISVLGRYEKLRVDDEVLLGAYNVVKARLAAEKARADEAEKREQGRNPLGD